VTIVRFRIRILCEQDGLESETEMGYSVGRISYGFR